MKGNALELAALAGSYWGSVSARKLRPDLSRANSIAPDALGITAASVVT